MITAVQYGKVAEFKPRPRLPIDDTPLPPPGEILWVIAVDPGATTGVAVFAIPHDSLLGDAPSALDLVHSFELTGSLQYRVSSVMFVARAVAARTGDHPALIVYEDFDLGGNRLTGSASQADVAIPIREAAAAQYAVESGHAERAGLIFQGRTIAFTTATDDRLRKWGLWVKGSDHERAARRHGITAIRRIKEGSINTDLIWGV
jgi:hypothetical protein